MDIVLLWPYMKTIEIGWEICSAIHFNAYSAGFKLLGSCVAYGLMLFQSLCNFYFVDFIWCHFPFVI